MRSSLLSIHPIALVYRFSEKTKQNETKHQGLSIDCSRSPSFLFVLEQREYTHPPL